MNEWDLRSTIQYLPKTMRYFEGAENFAANKRARTKINVDNFRKRIDSKKTHSAALKALY